MLQPGASIRVWSGAENEHRHAPPSDIFWTKRFIWNNNGDCAILVDNTGAHVSLMRIGMRKRPRKGTKADLERRLEQAASREAALQRALEEAEARAALAASAGAGTAGAADEARWSAELAAAKAVRPPSPRTHTTHTHTHTHTRTTRASVGGASRLRSTRRALACMLPRVWCKRPLTALVPTRHHPRAQEYEENLRVSRAEAQAELEAAAAELRAQQQKASELAESAASAEEAHAALLAGLKSNEPEAAADTVQATTALGTSVEPAWVDDGTLADSFPTPTLHGRCSCGQCGWEAVGPSAANFTCHCSVCRGVTQQPYTSAAGFKPSQVRWVNRDGMVEDTPMGSQNTRLRCGSCRDYMGEDATGVLGGIALPLSAATEGSPPSSALRHTRTRVILRCVLAAWCVRWFNCCSRACARQVAECYKPNFHIFYGSRSVDVDDQAPKWKELPQGKLAEESPDANTNGGVNPASSTSWLPHNGRYRKDVRPVSPTRAPDPESYVFTEADPRPNHVTKASPEKLKERVARK